MTDYLTVIEVFAIHEDQIASYGGLTVCVTEASWKRPRIARKRGFTPT